MASSDAPLVSTVIPVHNRAVMIRDAVRSVLEQTYRPIEIIVVDDGSTDETVSVTEELANAHPDVIRLLRQANSGVGLAREAGRRLARGEFIQYLDSDDVLLPEKFRLQVAALQGNADCAVAYGRTRLVQAGSEAEVPAVKRTGERIEAMFPSFLQSRWWDTSTPLYRRAVCDQAGPWTALSNEEDWEYDCRVAATGARLCYVDECISETRNHDENRLSANGSREAGKLRDRARAQALIYTHACRAGVPESAPEMAHFSRAAFLLARQCGAHGLEAESKQLFKLSRQACGAARANGLDYLAYDALTRLLGWRLAGRLACRLDKWRAQ